MNTTLLSILIIIYYCRIDNSPEFQFIDPELIIGINVGGQLFELPVQILVKDPFSLLAGICRINPVIKPDAYGIFYFDRDWWLFRHIISFLRSNALPRELETLKQLYAEASYYRINLLRKAIENISIHDITNFSPQIAVTWPGVMDGGENPLRREQQSYVLDGKLFSSLRK